MSTKLFLLVAFLIFPFVIFGQDSTSKKHAFIGVDACAPCHKTEKQGKQLEIWKNSKHAEAFKTLQTEKADKIAAELGHTTPAAETEDCLKCHVSGFDVDKSLLGAKFKIEEGVQCETCHGAGEDYKSLKIMKSREESIAHGLIVHDTIEAYCVSCHNPESPTYVPFEVEPMWEKIKHDVPESK
jgi:hypothetical protein